MKKTILTICAAILVIISFSAISGCGYSDHDHGDAEEMSVEDADHQHASVYQCPMKCEGEKTYEEAGTCPSCGMNLEEVEAAHNHDIEEHEDNEAEEPVEADHDEEDHEGHDHDEHEH